MRKTFQRITNWRQSKTETVAYTLFVNRRSRGDLKLDDRVTQSLVG